MPRLTLRQQRCVRLRQAGLEALPGTRERLRAAVRAAAWFATPSCSSGVRGGGSGEWGGGIRVTMKSAARRHCPAARSATGAVDLFNAALPASVSHVCGMSGTAAQSRGGMRVCCMRATVSGTTRFDSRGVSSGAVGKWPAEAAGGQRRAKRSKRRPGWRVRVEERKCKRGNCEELKKAPQRGGARCQAACWRLVFLHIFPCSYRESRRCDAGCAWLLRSGSPPATQSLARRPAQGSREAERLEACRAKRGSARAGRRRRVRGADFQTLRRGQRTGSGHSRERRGHSLSTRAACAA